MRNVLLSKGLSDKMLNEISELEAECCKYENLNFKLNWDMLNRRPADEVNDFICNDNNKLIGFLGLYCIGANPKVIEATGMVHPDYRRNGVFNELYNLAYKECSSRGAEKILLISERISESGKSFSESIDSKYSFSEYRMKFEGKEVKKTNIPEIVLRRAETGDCRLISEIDALCFGVKNVDENEYNDYCLPENDQDIIYIIEFKGKAIGKIGVLLEKGSGYIFGFGILPEYRGKGYGRQVLNLTLGKLVSEEVYTVLLEVSVENENALKLYESCGFKVITIYDYYEVKIN